MSAPSKEEIAAAVSAARRFVEGCSVLDDRVIVALADENERLRKTWHIKRCEKLDGEDPARRCRLAVDHEIDCDFGELERLRAENERLRAERAECLALLERKDNWTIMWEGARDAMVAKLRGQS